MSTLNVNTINAATSGQAVAVDLQNPKSFRNLVINGAMNIAQRTQSHTSAGGGFVCDRFTYAPSGVDGHPTCTQTALTSSDTGPWAKGFRNSTRIQNGNQTGGAGADDSIRIIHKIEAQDIANSGWDYTSASSYISFSFWVKSSVAQNFYVDFRSWDGTQQGYAMETGSLSANTWTKVTKKIPGNSNLQFDDNNDKGLEISFWMFNGTNSTSSVTLDQWGTYSGSARTPDQTSTWYTTNDALFSLTGVQLEVGDVATDFEHRTYADELRRCQRYCYLAADGASASLGLGTMYTSGSMITVMPFPVEMRTTPTLSATSGTNYYEFIRDSGTDWFNSFTLDNRTTPQRGEMYNNSETSGTVGHTGYIRTDNAAVIVYFTAEL